jgi:hypothetical protein
MSSREPQPKFVGQEDDAPSAGAGIADASEVIALIR